VFVGYDHVNIYFFLITFDVPSNGVTLYQQGVSLCHVTVLVNSRADKMTSLCGNSDVAQTRPPLHKVTPFDGILSVALLGGTMPLRVLNVETE
jgi:hypothetical protein